MSKVSLKSKNVRHGIDILFVPLEKNCVSFSDLAINL